jgi:hypothetical protein
MIYAAITQTNDCKKAKDCKKERDCEQARDCKQATDCKWEWPQERHLAESPFFFTHPSSLLIRPSFLLNHFCASFCKNVVEHFDESFKPSGRKTGQEVHL